MTFSRRMWFSFSVLQEPPELGGAGVGSRAGEVIDLLEWLKLLYTMGASLSEWKESDL